MRPYQCSLNDDGGRFLNNSKEGTPSSAERSAERETGGNVTDEVGFGSGQDGRISAVKGTGPGVCRGGKFRAMGALERRRDSRGGVQRLG